MKLASELLSRVNFFIWTNHSTIPTAESEVCRHWDVQLQLSAIILREQQIFIPFRFRPVHDCAQ
ncbi:MAG: hypothetical protein J07HQX50_02706 [Haloquadratum sp. J07HQX50]|nr:MAG: hypothetical protein J07HQX50_02706 [Haloquadratum sp. J07HQX50]